MNTISNPNDLIWVEGNLPDAKNFSKEAKAIIICPCPSHGKDDYFIVEVSYGEWCIDDGYGGIEEFGGVAKYYTICRS